MSLAQAAIGEGSIAQPQATGPAKAVPTTRQAVATRDAVAVPEPR